MKTQRNKGKNMRIPCLLSYIVKGHLFTPKSDGFSYSDIFVI